MKVIFDHNVPHKLRQELHGHEVITADDLGWATLKNGALLSEAEAAGFDVMITGDKNIAYQQNLSERTLALVVLANPDWRVLKTQVEVVLLALARATPGSFEQL